MKLKSIIYFLILSFTFSCAPNIKVIDSEKENIHLVLNQWHKDVATYNFEAYFDKMTDDAVFVGTDASEIWNKKQFMEFSKPYFEKKQTWDFKPLQRNIYASPQKNMMWFDETLDTWMGICRGSGVLYKSENGWKIKHYVLSVTVPNDDIQKVIEAKKATEKLILKK